MLFYSGFLSMNEEEEEREEGGGGRKEAAKVSFSKQLTIVWKMQEVVR